MRSCSTADALVLLDVGGHLVERAGQPADLVLRRHLDARAIVAVARSGCTPSLRRDRLRVSRADSGTMPMSARPMKPRPSPALRAAVRRSSSSASPTGRAMPNFNPDPVGSAAVTTTHSGSTTVPGARIGVASPPSEPCDRLAIRVGRRVERAGLVDRERHFAAVAARGREDRGEQVRQVDLGVDLADDLAVLRDAHVHAAAGERRLALHRGSRVHHRRGCELRPPPRSRMRISAIACSAARSPARSWLHRPRLWRSPPSRSPAAAGSESPAGCRASARSLSRESRRAARASTDPTDSAREKSAA